jgi:hypothetical protein
MARGPATNGAIMLRGVLRMVVLPALALVLLASPGRAVTCEETRALSASELAHWAKRLEVKPAYLGALLEKAFCEVPANGDRAAADRKRGRTKSLNTSNLD